jgi:hypothetical protein
MSSSRVRTRQVVQVCMFPPDCRGPNRLTFARPDAIRDLNRVSYSMRPSPRRVQMRRVWSRRALSCDRASRCSPWLRLRRRQRVRIARRCRREHGQGRLHLFTHRRPLGLRRRRVRRLPVRAEVPEGSAQHLRRPQAECHRSRRPDESGERRHGGEGPDRPGLQDHRRLDLLGLPERSRPIADQNNVLFISGRRPPTCSPA